MIPKTNAIAAFKPPISELQNWIPNQPQTQPPPRLTQSFKPAELPITTPQERLTAISDDLDINANRLTEPASTFDSNGPSKTIDGHPFPEADELLKTIQAQLPELGLAQNNKLNPQEGYSQTPLADQIRTALFTQKQLPVTELANFLSQGLKTRLTSLDDKNVQTEVQIEPGFWLGLSELCSCFNLAEFVASNDLDNQYKEAFTPDAMRRGDYVFNQELKYQNQDYWRMRLGPPRKILADQDKLAIKEGLLDEDHEFKNIDMTYGHMFGNKEWNEFLPDLTAFADLNALEEYTGHDWAVMNPFFVSNDKTASDFNKAKLQDPLQAEMALLKNIMVNSGINSMKAIYLLNEFSMEQTNTLANGKPIDTFNIPKNNLLQQSDLFGAQAPIPEKSDRLQIPPFVSMSDSFLVAKRFLGEGLKMYRLINDQSHVGIFSVSRMPSEREFILQQGREYRVLSTPTAWGKTFGEVYPDIPLVEVELVNKNAKTPISSLDLQSQYQDRPWLIKRMCDFAKHFERNDLLYLIGQQVPEMKDYILNQSEYNDGQMF